MPINTNTWPAYLTNIINSQHPFAHQIIHQLNRNFKTIDQSENDDLNAELKIITDQTLDQIHQKLNLWAKTFNDQQQTQWDQVVTEFNYNLIANVKTLAIMMCLYKLQLSINDYDRYYDRHDVEKYQYGKVLNQAHFEPTYHQLQKLEINFINLLNDRSPLK